MRPATRAAAAPLGAGEGRGRRRRRLRAAAAAREATPGDSSGPWRPKSSSSSRRARRASSASASTSSRGSPALRAGRLGRRRTAEPHGRGRGPTRAGCSATWTLGACSTARRARSSDPREQRADGLPLCRVRGVRPRTPRSRTPSGSSSRPRTRTWASRRRRARTTTTRMKRTKAGGPVPLPVGGRRRRADRHAGGGCRERGPSRPCLQFALPIPPPASASSTDLAGTAAGRRRARARRGGSGGTSRSATRLCVRLGAEGDEEDGKHRPSRSTSRRTRAAASCTRRGISRFGRCVTRKKKVGALTIENACDGRCAVRARPAVPRLPRAGRPAGRAQARVRVEFYPASMGNGSSAT